MYAQGHLISHINHHFIKLFVFHADQVSDSKPTVHPTLLAELNQYEFCFN